MRSTAGGMSEWNVAGPARNRMQPGKGRECCRRCMSQSQRVPGTQRSQILRPGVEQRLPGRGGGRWGARVQRERRFRLQDRSVLRRTMASCTVVWCAAHRALKAAEKVSFTLCVFHHNRRNWGGDLGARGDGLRGWRGGTSGHHPLCYHNDTLVVTVRCLLCTTGLHDVYNVLPWVIPAVALIYIHYY